MTLKFRVGEWTVDPAACQLAKDGHSIHVRAKVMDLLVYFAARPGDVVSKDALLDGVWASEALSESALTRTITELRQALGDSAESPRILETIPKRGYRLIAAVHPAVSEVVSATSDGPIRRKRGRVWLFASTSLAALLLLLALDPLRTIISHVIFARTPGSEISTVVVLPLKNLTGDPGQDYFVDGMTETLTDTLSQIGAFSVISSTSAARYRNVAKTAAQIARELGGVDALVEGSVLKSNDHLRVTVALIQATTDWRLWTGTYEHDADTLALHNHPIALMMARGVSELVSSSDKAGAGSLAFRPGAYDAYVRGSQIVGLSDGGGECLVVEHYYAFPQIETDRTFTVPYADLAWRSVYPGRLQQPVAELGPRARSYATGLRVGPRPCDSLQNQ